jgi:carboxymethylenebutenolidase
MGVARFDTIRESVTQHAFGVRVIRFRDGARRLPRIRNRARLRRRDLRSPRSPATADADGHHCTCGSRVSIPPRLAGDGYNALAIDLLSEEGGTASMPSEGGATAALSKAPAERMIADLRAGLDHLQQRAPNAKLAVIGFCFGGGMTWQLLAAGEPRLSAAVPFYGPAPADPDFSGSPNAAVLGIYTELDSRVNASQDTARTALEAAVLVHEIRVFPGVDHAFFNDTGARYDDEQATAAYQAMIDWFGQHLAPATADPNAAPPTGG